MLRIPAIQSPDYVPGVSGWIIRQDGSAEFNNGTFRGSIEVGPITGQHFIVNNPATGDVIDIYNSANQLIFSIDANGVVRSIDPSTGLYVQISQATLSFNSQTAPLAVASRVQQGYLGSDPLLSLTSGKAAGGTPVEIDLFSSSVGAGQAVATINQYGISGSIVQNDNGSGQGSGNLIHPGSYSGTTDANGQLIVNHHCNFTPAGAVIVGNTMGGGRFANLTSGVNNLTTTQMQTNWTNAGNGTPYANLLITFYAILWQ